MSEPVVGPSGPRPGVERAIEIIEARLQTWFHAGQPAYNVSGHSLDADCWHCHEAATQAAEAIVAAIPSLDAEALAELVGGEVEEADAPRRLIGYHYDMLANASIPQYEEAEPAIRVVTPWRSVTSPEGPRS